LIDAGHIAIESNLADKQVLREVHLKRNQKYSEEDYRRLESLMYDKFFLRLESAQVPFVSFVPFHHVVDFGVSLSLAMTSKPAARL
jgi:hypothetical protein